MSATGGRRTSAAKLVDHHDDEPPVRNHAQSERKQAKANEQLSHASKLPGADKGVLLSNIGR